MFQPQENLHCVPAAHHSRFVYVPVSVPFPVYAYPEHYPEQPPNFYPQPLNTGMYKQGGSLPFFRAPHYDVPFMVNTPWTAGQEWATNKTHQPNQGGHEMRNKELLEREVMFPAEPEALTETGSSPESMSPPQASVEMKQTLTRPPDSNNGGREMSTDHLMGGKAMFPPEPVFVPENASLPKMGSPFEPAPLPWTVPPFKPVPSQWTTFPFEPMSPAWTAFPYEHMSLPGSVPPFGPMYPHKLMPPPKPFTKTEQKLEVQLFIGGLDFGINKQQLYKEFLPFGDLISAKVIMKNGRSKGYGFVVYSNHGDAEAAIREMNGKLVGKKQLFVTLSKGKEESRTEQKMGDGLDTKEQTQS